MDLMEFINDIPLKNEIIKRADFNAAVGVCKIYENEWENNNKDTINDLIGPHGTPRQNDSGTNIREVLWELDYQAVHNMWIHPAMKEGYQPNHFLILCNQLRNIIDVKSKFDGTQGNHCTLFITYEVGNETNFPSKVKSKVQKESYENWQ